jgi:hypothetical protein
MEGVKMAKFTLNVWLSLIPLLLQFISTVEGMFGSGTGAEKKENVMAMVKEVFNNLGTVFGDAAVNVPSFDSLNPIISTMIDILVKLLNFLGIFKKGS